MAIYGNDRRDSQKCNEVLHNAFDKGYETMVNRKGWPGERAAVVRPGRNYPINKSGVPFSFTAEVGGGGDVRSFFVWAMAGRVGRVAV